MIPILIGVAVGVLLAFAAIWLGIGFLDDRHEYGW